MQNKQTISGWFIPSGPMRCFYSTQSHDYITFRQKVSFYWLLICLLFYFLHFTCWYILRQILNSLRQYIESRTERGLYLNVYNTCYLKLAYVHCGSELALFVVVVPESRLSCRLRCDISCVKVPTMLCSSFIDRCCFETFWFWFAHWSKLASLP